MTEDQKAGFENAGYEVATRMIEAIKAKIAELVEWFKSLPGKILEAIGSIDLGSIIQWPTPPDWWTNRPSWLGGSSGEPANDNSGNSGHRAAGGPVHRGGSFLVGEREPEIFTPKTGGTITPVSQLGGGGVRIDKIEVHGVSDPERAADLVVQKLEGRLGMLMRGTHADMGAR